MRFISLRGLWGLLILFSVQWAQADAEQKYFYDENNIEKLQQPDFQKHKDSVFRLSYSGEGFGPPGSCTNTMISDEGHFVTALHCIKYCLRKHDALATFFEFQMGPGLPKDAFIGAHIPTMMGKKCKAFDPITEKEIEVEYVISGPGTNLLGSAPMPGLIHLFNQGETGKQMATEMLWIGLAGNLDFAILKRTDQDKAQSCVPFTKEKSSTYLDNKNVWTLSYPAPTGWENENLANVVTRLYSSGRVYSNYVKYPKLKEFVDGVPKMDEGGNIEEFVGGVPLRGTHEDIQEGKNAIFNMDSNKIANLPAQLGSSGASIFDHEGEVAGVLSFTINLTKKGEPRAPGATYFVGAPEIRSFVENDFKKELDADKIFGCSK